MELTEKQIEEVVNFIQGSCESLDNAIAVVTEDTIDGLDGVTNWEELCAAVDRAHFLCAQCGWWCEVGDYAETQDNPNGDICTDCGPEDADD